MKTVRLLMIFVLLIAACGGRTSTANEQTAPTLEVHAAGFLFEPDQVEVLAGTRVTWINDDDILHTVSSGTPDSPIGVFNRELDGRDTSTSIEFTAPGVYQYFCSRHPHMTGVVTVNEPDP